MKINFSALDQELAACRDVRLPVPLWWRDDDAVTQTPALDRLIDIGERLGIAAHLAVIPKGVQPDLRDVCGAEGPCVALVHGWAHENHAPSAAKKAEFGIGRDAAPQELQCALEKMENCFGQDFLPIFVPPWNRIDPALVPRLSQMGYIGLSTFTPRAARHAAPDLVQINTHLDPIFWKGHRSLADPESLIQQCVTLLRDRRKGRSDGSEPFGFLTHHLVHDDAIWRFTERFLDRMLQGGAVPVDLSAQRDTLP